MLFIRGPYLNLRLLIYAGLSIALMVLDYHENHVQQLRTVLSTAVVPIQYVADWPAKFVFWFQTSLATQQALVEENANLRAQLLLRQAQVQKLLAIEKENAQLRALLKSSPRASERVLIAQLLSVNPEPFVQQVVLNKGWTDGVFVGQAVIDGTGVFGQVIQVGPITSRVLLITDPQSTIPVVNNRNGLRGFAVGTGNSQALSLIAMPQTADIKPGDLLVTSGLGGRFPAGYPVGEIRSVVYNSGQEFAKITIFPSAQLSQSRLVLLVWNVTDLKSKAAADPKLDALAKALNMNTKLALKDSPQSETKNAN